MLDKITNGARLLWSYVANYGPLTGGRLYWQTHVAKRPLIAMTPPGSTERFWLRSLTTDLAEYGFVFAGKELDVPNASQPKVIIDCGAHIGCTAVLFANRFPEATIYALEPEESNFELLQRNATPYPNIVPLKLGVWTHPSHLKIVDAGYGHWGFMTEEVDEGVQGAIEATSIDELMRRYGISQIDICKINVEGAEREVFEEAADSWLPHTKAILIELHDHMRPGSSESFVRALMPYHFSLRPNGSAFVLCQLQGTREH
jgi:FkbM family methyltransferase